MHLTRKSEVLGSIHTFVSPSAFSRRAVVSYWRKYVHEVLVNRLGGLRLPRKSVVRLIDCPNMTLDVYRGRNTTIQQQQFNMKVSCVFSLELPHHGNSTDYLQDTILNTKKKITQNYPKSAAVGFFLGIQEQVRKIRLVHELSVLEPLKYYNIATEILEMVNVQNSAPHTLAIWLEMLMLAEFFFFFVLINFINFYKILVFANQCKACSYFLLNMFSAL